MNAYCVLEIRKIRIALLRLKLRRAYFAWLSIFFKKFYVKPLKKMACHTKPYAKYGAGDRIRTSDLLITNQLLYQLSYAGIYTFFWSGKRGSNSQPTAWKAVALPIELFPHISIVSCCCTNTKKLTIFFWSAVLLRSTSYEEQARYSTF